MTADRALRTPPLAPLRARLAALERAGLAHALGASGLLAALGLVSEVRDWDVTVEAGVEEIAALYPEGGFTRHGPGGGHADHKLSFEADRVELIAGFAFAVAGGVVRIPTVVTGRWQELPLGSPLGWAVAYALLAQAENSARRRHRADALFAWLAVHGADPVTRTRLAREPLPTALRERVAALPTAGPR